MANRNNNCHESKKKCRFKTIVLQPHEDKYYRIMFFFKYWHYSVMYAICNRCCFYVSQKADFLPFCISSNDNLYILRLIVTYGVDMSCVCR